MGKKVVIIGGGASGLAAGIQAARTGASVTILEHMDRVGKKILSTGNGKCNLTNRKMGKDCYRCDQEDFPMKVICNYPVETTLEFFEGLGILPKDKSGYIYPNSEQAAAVLDVLRMEAEHLEVLLICGCEITDIQVRGRNQFYLNTSQGTFRCEALILATGSKAAPATGSDGSGYLLAGKLGHRIIKPLPALVQLRCQGNHYKQLAGIRTQAGLKLWTDGKLRVEEQGELQITDYGISGIPVFQISRYAAKALDQKQKTMVTINYLPSFSLSEVRELLENRRKNMGFKTAEEYLVGLLNKKLGIVLLKLAGISPAAPVSKLSARQWNDLFLQITSMQACVTAVNPFANAQICCGGVDTTQIREDTLESKLVKGLYLVGELLDVDGICGGYNLQWAWSSGSIAGFHAANREEQT